MNDIRMPFGKYKGNRVIDILHSNFNYIVWLRSTVQLREGTEFAQYMSLNASNLNYLHELYLRKGITERSHFRKELKRLFPRELKLCKLEDNL